MLTLLNDARQNVIRIRIMNKANPNDLLSLNLKQKYDAETLLFKYNQLRTTYSHKFLVTRNKILSLPVVYKEVG